jgi:hypothetical protein
MALVPERQRHAFMHELTEAVVERYYAERGGFTTPYSYVVHEAATEDGRPHPHTHIVLPDMADHALDGQVPFVNYKNKGHLQLLDDIANQELIQALDRTLGRAWRQGLGLPVPTSDLKPDDPGYLDAWFPR